jgi:hypothetical protein
MLCFTRSADLTRAASARTRIPIVAGLVAAQQGADACCVPGYPAIRIHSHALRHASRKPQVDEYEASSYKHLQGTYAF